MTTVGFYGDGVRGDAEVTVTSGGPWVEVDSIVESMYGAAIRRQIDATLTRFGSPEVGLRVRDGGALPFVLEARLEAALASHLDIPIPEIPRRSGNPEGVRLQRTRLYVPGNTPKLFPNIGLYAPDGIILDLEDSVPASAKFAARAMVGRALHHLDWGQATRIVRVNSGALGTEDIQALAGQGVDAFFIPKAEDPEAMREISNLLDDLDVPTAIIPLIETAQGVRLAYELAKSTPRIRTIAFGLEDYLSDIHALRSESGAETAWAHGQMVNAARAAGVAPLASVFADVEDDRGMFEYARRMAGLGFEGVGCLHPRQIRPAHRGFAPSVEAVEEAQEIVSQYDRAVEENLGVISVRGRMVDVPVYERAKRVLERAR